MCKNSTAYNGGNTETEQIHDTECPFVQRKHLNNNRRKHGCIGTGESDIRLWCFSLARQEVQWNCSFLPSENE